MPTHGAEFDFPSEGFELSFTDEDLKAVLHTGRQEFDRDRKLAKAARAAVFRNVLETLEHLNPPTSNPRQERCRLFEGYQEGLISRRVLVIRYPKRGQRQMLDRVIVNDEQLLDTDLTKRIVRGQEFVVREVGKLITFRKCQILAGSAALVGPDGFRIVPPMEDKNYVSIEHGSNFAADPLVEDRPFVTDIDLERRRVDAEKLAAIIQPLRLSDSVLTDFSFERAA